MPKLSVFITNYNHAQYLQQSIDSVLNQTYQDFELIIVDDGSTDNSRELIMDACGRDMRVKAEFFPENMGCFAAINRAMSLCTGEYIFPRAADDHLIDMQFFERAMYAVEQAPYAAGAFAASQIISGDDGRTMWCMGSTLEDYLSPARCRHMFLTSELFIPGASAIWKREYVDAVGGFDPELGPQADYYINHLLPMKHGVVAVGGVVAVVLHFTGAMSKQSVERLGERHGMVEQRMRAHVFEMDDDDMWWSWRAAHLVPARVNA